MSGPPPSWNDPDWPTGSGWVPLVITYLCGVGTVVALAFLIGSLL